MKKMFFTCLALCCLISPTWAANNSVPSVVVSIKPLHSLVAGVMQGVGEPTLLVKGGGSPHGYVMRPSEAKAIAKAQLVVWVGHDLESFLDKPLATLGKNAVQLELAEQLKGHLLTKRQGGSWSKGPHSHGHHEAEHHEAEHHEAEHHEAEHHEAEHHEAEHHEAEHHEAEHHEAEHQSPDLHLWLNPVLAQKVVNLTRDALSEMDPEHQSQYQANAEKMLKKLDQLHQKLTEKLAPVKDTPYIVFHAAYQYFEEAYGLNAVGSITIDPSRKPGAKKVKEIRHKIKHLGAKCVFSEPQFESRLVATVIEGTGAKTGSLDPIGSNLTAGPDTYFQLMTNLADDLYEGLK